MESIISFKQLSLTREDEKGPRPILSNINFLFEGSVLVIGGPSGAGKTSLIRMINGLSSPTSGSVSVFGKPTQDWNPRALRQQVGYVCQQPVALTQTAEEDLKLACHLSAQAYDVEIIKEMFEVLGLDEIMLNQSVTQFSVGERQRFAVIRALCAQPKILLLDEPTSALDEPRAHAMHALLMSRVKMGQTMVMIEHRPALLETYAGQDVQTLSLNKGSVLEK
jgi:putative ABC transport system ATP-binding protein